MENLELFKNGKVKFWNIVIGVNHYHGRYQNLSFARQSAYRVLASLDKAQERFGTRKFFLHTDGFQQEQYDLPSNTSCQDASVQSVLETIEHVAKRTYLSSCDVVTFFFFGHGVVTPLGKLMLCLSDTEVSDTEASLLKNALSVADLFRLLKDSGISRRLVINACRTCHSFGNSEKPDSDDVEEILYRRYRKTFQVLLSCEFNQVSLDQTVESRQDFIAGIPDEVVYPNPFADALIDGLEGRGRLDTGAITLQSLFEYIQRSMEGHSSQRPQLLPNSPASSSFIMGYYPKAYSWEHTGRYFEHLERIIEYQFPLSEEQMQELHSRLFKDFRLTPTIIQGKEELLFAQTSDFLQETQKQCYVFLQKQEKLGFLNLWHFFHFPIERSPQCSGQKVPFGKALMRRIRRQVLDTHCLVRNAIYDTFKDRLSQSSTCLTIGKNDIVQLIPDYLEIVQQQAKTYQLEPFGQALILYLWDQAVQSHQATYNAYRDRLIQAKFQGLADAMPCEQCLNGSISRQIQQTVEDDWQKLQDFLASYRSRVRAYLIRNWLSSNALELSTSNHEFLEAWQVKENLAISVQSDRLKTIQSEVCRAFQADIDACRVECEDLAKDIYPVSQDKQEQLKVRYTSLDRQVVEKLFKAVDNRYQEKFDELSVKLAVLIQNYYGQDNFLQKYEEFENFTLQVIGLSQATVKILYKRYEKYAASVRLCVGNGHSMSSSDDLLDLDAGALKCIRQNIERDISKDRFWEYLQDEELRSI
jgi:hypothetical protein